MKVIKAGEGEIFDIELEEDLLKRNKELAEENKRLLDENGIIAIDVMGSVGTGKTSFLVQLAKSLKNRYKMATIAGDLTTSIDAERVREAGMETVQVNTGKECHLDANLVRKALKELDLQQLDLLFVENVGNLICPAEFPLGSHKRIVVISVTEGPYMVMKHPYIFMEAALVVLNKIDLAQAMGIDPSALEADVCRIKPDLPVVKTDCLRGEGIAEAAGALGL